MTPSQPLVGRRTLGSWTVHAIQVGGPPRDDYLRMFELSRRAFDRVLAVMAPGATWGDLARVYLETLQGTGYAPGPVLFIGRGTGEDEPMGGPGSGEAFLGSPLRVGNVVIVKPAVATRDHSFTVNVGDTVAVTEHGVRRLGKRELAPIVTGG